MDKLTILRNAGHPNCSRIFRPLSVTVTGAEMEIRTLRRAGVDEEFFVIETVAMVKDAVIRPMGSTVPEYVPGDIHEGALHTFKGRPVVMNHPEDEDGNPVSANEPNVLESYQFGYVFEPYYDEDRGLILPVWLNAKMADDVGDDASKVISDLQDAISREESVGVYAYIETLEGTSPNDEKFGAIWLDYDADHLAFLNEGDLGACSNVYGCGPVFTSNSRNAQGDSMNKWKQTALKATAKLQRLVGITYREAMIDGELSNHELGEKLWGALSLDEGSAFEWYGWITEVYAKQGIVIYKALDMSGEDGDNDNASVKMWQRGYKIKDGTLTLKNDKTEVVGFTPVLKDGQDVNATNDVEPVSNSPTTRKDLTMPKPSKEVTRLAGVVVECENCPFIEDDRSFLETKDEKFLEGILETYAGSEDDNDDDAGIPAGSTGPVDLSDDTPEFVQVPREEWEANNAWIAEAKPVIASAQQRAAKEKEKLVTAIDALNPAIAKDVYREWSNKQLVAYYKDLSRGVQVVRDVSDTSNVDANDLVPDYTLNGLDLPSTGRVKVDKIPSGLAGLRSKKQEPAAAVEN